VCLRSINLQSLVKDVVTGRLEIGTGAIPAIPCGEWSHDQ